MSDELRKMLDQFRQLNDPGNLRSALDVALGVGRVPALDQLRTHINEVALGSAGLSEAAKIAMVLSRPFYYDSQLVSGRLPGYDAIMPGVSTPSIHDVSIGVHRSQQDILRDVQNQFATPHLSEIEKLMRNHGRFGAVSGFGSIHDVYERMATMKSPWLDINQQALSVHAFIDVHAVGGLASARNPFSASVGASLRAQLGDWRDRMTFDVAKLVNPLIRYELYDERGFNRNLTHFTEEAYRETVHSAGLVLDEDEPIDFIEEDDEEVVRNSKAYTTLLRFEREMRAFIVKQMVEAFGDGWMKRQLPPNMLETWISRKETARANGAEDLPLIEYADFPDYKLIIERKDNWAQVFKAIFGRQEDIRESLQRLFPVRIATMHARFLTLDDDLLLRSETNRILKRMRQ